MSDNGTARSSQRQHFTWNLIGTGCYYFSQWLLLVVLARVSGAVQVGHFTLILAITAPIFLSIGMNLRVVIATDAAHRWRMADLFGLQYLLNMVAALVSIIASWLVGLRGDVLGALVVVVVAKSVEARSEVYYGYFQRNARFDRIARSMVARALAGPAAFLCGWYATQTLTGATVGLAVSWLICQLLVDVPSARLISATSDLPLREGGTSRARLRALARVAFPLGLDQGVSSLAVNVPRYAVQTVAGAGPLGIYAAIAYFGLATSMVTSSLSVIVVSPLSRYHHNGQTQAFVRGLSRLAVLATGILILGPTGAWLVGGPLLRMTLGHDFEDPRLLVVIMIAFGLMNLQRSLCKALEASQQFRIYLLIDTITTAVIAATAWPFTRRWGPEGAAWAMALGFAIGTVPVLLAILRIVHELKRRPDQVVR